MLGGAISFAELVKARHQFRVVGVLAAVWSAIAVAAAVRGDRSLGWDGRDRRTGRGVV